MVLGVVVFFVIEIVIRIVGGINFFIENVEMFEINNILLKFFMVC